VCNVVVLKCYEGCGGDGGGGWLSNCIITWRRSAGGESGNGVPSNGVPVVIGAAAQS
jgi:hypothetical protein